MSADATKLYLRRLRPHTTDPLRLTVGKLYELKGSPHAGAIGTVIDDGGREFFATHQDYWQKVWVLPDGSEVPAL